MSDRPLVDGLMAHGYTVHLVNTAAIHQYEGLKYTDDHSDARWLAHLLRLGVPPPQGIFIPARIDRCAIFSASAVRWCGNVPPIC